MIRPLLIGHRGARSVRTLPENTLPSFDLALEHGCDGIEFDVRMTTDSCAVISHDPVWHDPASHRKAGVAIAGATREELGTLPLLSEVLDRYRQRAFLDIELKVRGLEQALGQVLQTNPPGPGFVVSSFLPEALLDVHSTDSTLPLGLICETGEQLKRWPELPVWFVIPHQRLLTSEVFWSLRSAGKKVMVWTVNREDEMRRFARMGVDGIISDETDLLVRTLRGQDSPKFT